MSQHRGLLSVMRFHLSVVADIIEPVRRNWVMVGVTALVSLAACTSGTAKTGEPVAELPINPTPTAAGQVVVLAGNGGRGLPVDGAYAVRTPVTPVGRVLALPDDSLVFPVQYDGYSDSRLARLTPDGRIHLRMDIHGGDQYTSYAVSGSNLWILQPSVDQPGSLTKTSLDGDGKTTMLSWSDEGTNHFAFEDSRGRRLRPAERHRLATGWDASALGIRHDGKPIVAVDNGDLYQVLGKNRLRRWAPPGYEKARDKASIGRVFNTRLIVDDQDAGLVIIGWPGLIRLPKSGEAVGISFPGAKSGEDLSPTGAFSVASHSLVVADFDAGILEIDENGKIRVIAHREDGKCNSQTVSEMNAARIGGLVKRFDGTLVITNLSCGRVYGIRL